MGGTPYKRTVSSAQAMPLLLSKSFPPPTSLPASPPCIPSRHPLNFYLPSSTAVINKSFSKISMPCCFVMVSASLTLVA